MSSKHRDLVLGVDVGGTKTTVLVTDSRLTPLSQLTLPTVTDGAEGILQGLTSAIARGVLQAGRSMTDVRAIGVGIPGRVDPATGVVRQAVNLGSHVLHVGEALTAQFEVPCVVENDVRAAVLGIQHRLAEKAPHNLAYVAVGTGIAAGLILDNKLYRGAHNLAGEIGHMVLVPDGPLCVCGGHGCLESLVAGPAIARLGQETAHRAQDSILNGYQTVTPEAVYYAARAGDTAALAITHQAASYLALALQQLIMAYDIECIYLGGGVSRGGEEFLRPLLHSLAHLRAGSTLTDAMIGEPDIHLLPLDYSAGAWGAVLLASAGPAYFSVVTADGRGGGDSVRKTAVE